MATIWKVNGLLGLTVFLFTYVFSIMNNTWATSLFRAGIGFLLFFLLGFVLRFVLFMSTKMKNQVATKPTQVEENPPKEELKMEYEQASTEERDFEALPLQQLHDGRQTK